MKNYKFYCPKCKQKMEKDIHAPEDGAIWKNQPNLTTEEFRKMDIWFCLNCGIYLDRDDLNIK